MRYHAFIRHPIAIDLAETAHGRGFRLRLYRWRMSLTGGKPPWAQIKPCFATWVMKFGRRTEFRLPGRRMYRLDFEWLPLPAPTTRKFCYQCPSCGYTAGRKAFVVRLEE